MIRRVTIRNFKRFREHKFELADSVVLAGPNNAGKSTLLQGIATWKLGLDRWLAQRKGDKSKAVKRTGVAITRGDFTTVPLREMNLLWEGRQIYDGPGKPPRFVEIVVEGGLDENAWDCGLELQYTNPELVYVRPWRAKGLDSEDILNFPPRPAEELDVVHVPPLSGIERDEPRRDRGMQDLLVGQGRPGEILRNLLWEISSADKQESWEELKAYIRDLFSLDLLQPSYSPTQPYIVCEYREPDHARPLDLSNVGSGTLQVLLMLAFLYARPATVILLDEPDSHQHVILQKQVYSLIRKVASKRGGQVIVATHSEVILDATEPTQVIEFFSDAPRALASERERDQAREALKRVTTTELLLGREVGAVLYVEGKTDEKILTEWARILDHPAMRFLRRPFVHWLRGRGLHEARDHFFAMQAAFPNIRALCLLDGDNLDEPDEKITKAGLVVLRWHRYEIENYLLQPGAIRRFIDFPLMESLVDVGFQKHVPPDTDLFGDHVSLERVKASTEFLIPLLEEIGRSTPKKDLYLLASAMNKDEIHPEVREKLDRIADTLNPR
ncbi:MAG: AAA family ATPase [Truepera sp.]|nr:AAA family ATPase [Truepera sp.]